MLDYCNHCKENSMGTKMYTRLDGTRKRVLYCINKGCGNSIDITLPKEHYEHKEKAQARTKGSLRNI